MNQNNDITDDLNKMSRVQTAKIYNSFMFSNI